LQFKNIVLDIDGTLIDDHLELSDRTIRAINTLADAGKRIIFCTGRMHGSTVKIIEKFFPGRVFPIISYNGSMVIIPGRAEPVIHHKIDPQTSKEIIRFLRENGVHGHIYVDDRLISEVDNDEIQNYSVHSGMDYSIVDDLIEFIDKKDAPVKILAIGEPEILESVERTGIAQFSDKVNIFKSFSIYLDFIPKATNKGIALEELADYMNFNLNETMMIGDGDNDVFAFEVVNYSVAMQNATPKLKEYADSITEKDNNNEGAYHALARIFGDLIGQV